MTHNNKWALFRSCPNCGALLVDTIIVERYACGTRYSPDEDILDETWACQRIAELSASRSQLIEAALAVVMSLGWRERCDELSDGPIHALDALLYAITGRYNVDVYTAVEGLPSWAKGADDAAP